MKRIILCLSLFAFFGSQAQQINPVPDYVFSNKMSVGRNAVTDTAAYFSIGPRYGANKGLMPPMVTDTASMSATKRNGLLIFSIQKNKYLYWDSVGSKWAEMAGTAGSAITGSGVAGYMPEFTTATNIDTTRLYHSNGRFAIGSTATSNGVFNVYGGQSYFDTSLMVGSQTLLADEGKNEVYVNTTSDAGAYAFQVAGAMYATGNLNFATGDVSISNISNNVLAFGTNNTERMRLKADGEFLIGTTTDAGNYNLQVNGDIYNTGGGILVASGTGEIRLGNAPDRGAYMLQVDGPIHGRFGADFAVGGGEVGIGTASPGTKLAVQTTSTATGVFQNDMFRLQATTAGRALTMSFSDGTNQALIGAVSGALYFGRTGNAETMRLKSDGEVIIGTTSDAGAFLLQVNGVTYSADGLRTGAPAGGTAATWKLGTVASVSPTSPNRTIEVDIGGTIYYIHAKTTND